MGERRRDLERGFSVIELLVVLALIVVLAGVAGFAIVKSRKAGSQAAAADIAFRELERLRAEARATRTNTTFRADEVAGRFGVGGDVTLGATSSGPPGYTVVRNVTFEGQSGFIPSADPAPVVVLVESDGSKFAVTVNRAGVIDTLAESGNQWRRR
jgi:prepilin-type N-terminal cleavage/methylation domain-containing protein